MEAVHVPLLITPDPDEPSCATIEVCVRIGDLPLTFGLDSGARRSQILDDISSQWPVRGTEVSHTVFSEHVDSYVEAPLLHLGGLEIRGLEMTRIGHTTPGAQNLLGLDVLQHHRCLLDLTSETLTLNAAVDGIAMMPLYLDEVGHAYLDVCMGDELESAVWDTGAGITIVDTSLVARHPQFFTEVEPTTGTDAAGQTEETPTYLMAPVSIGGVAFEAHKVAAIDLAGANANLKRPMALILGFPTLRQTAWLIDFPQRQWALLPSDVRLSCCEDSGQTHCGSHPQ